MSRSQSSNNSYRRDDERRGGFNDNGYRPTGNRQDERQRYDGGFGNGNRRDEQRQDNRRSGSRNNYRDNGYDEYRQDERRNDNRQNGFNGQAGNRRDEQRQDNRGSGNQNNYREGDRRLNYDGYRQNNRQDDRQVERDNYRRDDRWNDNRQNQGNRGIPDDRRNDEQDDNRAPIFIPDYRQNHVILECLKKGAQELDYSKDKDYENGAPELSEWADLPVSETTLANLQRVEYGKPRKIQTGLMMAMEKEHQNVIVEAEPGSGVTTGYSLPIIQKICEEKNKGNVAWALIIVPNVLFARNVLEILETFAESTGLHIAALQQSTHPSRQLLIMNQSDIIVATAGCAVRVVSNSHRAENLKFVVWDNLEYFRHTTGAHINLLEHLAMFDESRSTILCSAPENENLPLFEKHMRPDKDDQKRLRMRPINKKLTDRISVKFAPVIGNMSEAVMNFLIEKNLEAETNMGTTIVFVDDYRVKEIADDLNEKGFQTCFINSQSSSEEKNYSLNELDTGKLDALVTSDWSAEGVQSPHIKNLICLKFHQNPEKAISQLKRRLGKIGRNQPGTVFMPVNFSDEYSAQRLIAIHRYFTQAGRKSPTWVTTMVLDFWRPPTNYAGAKLVHALRERMAENKEANRESGESQDGSDESIETASLKSADDFPDNYSDISESWDHPSTSDQPSTSRQ